MSKGISLNLSESEVEALLKLEKESSCRSDFRLYRRCRAILAIGWHKVRQYEVARLLGVSKRMVINWVNLYKAEGLDGLELEKCGGSKARLNDDQKARLSEIIESGPEVYGLDTAVWTSPLVREVVVKEFGIKYDVSHIRRILDKLGFSCQYPRVHLSKADHKKQKQWLENEYPTIKKSQKAKRGGNV